MFNIISLTLAWRMKGGSLKLSYKRNSGWHRVWFYLTQVSICENRREFAMTYSSQEIQFHQIDIPSMCLPLAISLQEIENIHKSTSLPSLWVHCLGIPRVNRANMGTTKSSCLLFYLFQIWLYKCWLYMFVATRQRILTTRRHNLFAKLPHFKLVNAGVSNFWCTVYVLGRAFWELIIMKAWNVYVYLTVARVQCKCTLMVLVLGCCYG